MSEVNGHNKNGLPKDWGIVRLGDYAKTEKGKKPKFVSKEQTKEFSIPYVNIKAFEQNIIDEYTDGVGCVLCEDDDFLMVWDGSRSGYVGKAIKGALGSTLVKIKLPDVDHDFAYYFLQSKFIEINSRAKGVGIPHVDPNIVWNYKFPLPPPDTQQQIVSKIEELFSELDKGIEELKTAQQQLKVYRQAVLKWAFENETENREVKLLSEVSAKIQIGPFGTQLHKEDYIVGGIPLINPMHIQEGQIMADSSYSIKEEKRDSLPNYILQNGDVIMGRRGEMGRCGLVTDKEEGWFCGTGSLYVRPNKKLIDSKFLYHLLQSRSIKKYLDQNAGGTTMANLNLKIVNNIPLHLPTLEEQQQIVQEIESRLSVCDKIEETITNSLKQAEALRQSILKKAFEGKLL
jgi:type I restriction enzyme S subunit